jgi:hypothetical protein
MLGYKRVHFDGLHYHGDDVLIHIITRTAHPKILGKI